METKINYLARNYEDFQTELEEFSNKYYPEMSKDFKDASVGKWFIDIVSAVADDLSFHIDRVFQETNINSAQEGNSVLSLARSNGFRVPGRKASMAEVEFSCELNVYYDVTAAIQTPDWTYAPTIKKGTVVSSGRYIFELTEDVDFSQQFNSDGISNRQIIPKRNSNGIIEKYTIKKTAIVLAGETKVYKREIKSSDLVPFMEVILPDLNVMNVESIIFKNGTDYVTDPNTNDYMIETEYMPSGNVTKTETWRYFEVESLLDQYRFGDVLNSDGIPEKVTMTHDGQDYSQVVKGEWKPLKQKFITEFTDKGYLKIIFGTGEVNKQIDPSTSTFAKYQISHMLNDTYMGELPNAGWTMYVLYRVGGGKETNVARGAITDITYLNVELHGSDTNTMSEVRDSISVTNTVPSVSGKDAPTVDEVRYMIKYNNGAQDRCVQLKDYYVRLMQMPAKYGCPFRVGIIENNNKIMMYLLGLDYDGTLSAILPDALVTNIENYLSEYRMLNDYIEIKSGKIINIAFEIDVFISKSYNKNDVMKLIIDTVNDYMDINKHQMGEDIYIGDLEKEISKLDGVLNLIDLRVFNRTNNFGGRIYSSTVSTQPAVTMEVCEGSSLGNAEYTSESAQTENSFQIDLDESEGTLFSEADSMFEVKYADSDVIVRAKIR